MKTYKILVEETVLVNYWIEAPSEQHAYSIWKNGDIAEWDRHEKEANDVLISIVLDSDTTND